MAIQRTAYDSALFRMWRKLGQDRFTLHILGRTPDGKLQGEFRPIA